MKILWASALLLISVSSFAMTEEQCKYHVEINIDSFSICSNSGTTRWSGEDVINFSVMSCKQAHANANWKCMVEQSPWPSNDCIMEIELDKNCYFNISTRITQEGREDM